VTDQLQLQLDVIAVSQEAQHAAKLGVEGDARESSR
jgi:hypothetical protein